MQLCFCAYAQDCNDSRLQPVTCSHVHYFVSALVHVCRCANLNRAVSTAEGKGRGQNLLDNVCHYFTLTCMRTAKTVSITLPPDLLVKARALAEREHRTMSELFREALRRYMAGHDEWDSLLKRTRATGAALGIMNEADVERICHE